MINGDEQTNAFMST